MLNIFFKEEIMFENYIKKGIFLTCFLSLLTVGAADSKLEQKVDSLVSQMSLDDKLKMIHGEGFNIHAIKRLGIPAINMSDASIGLRVTPWPHSKGLEPSTAFPDSLLLTATWNPDVAAKYATAVAEEFKARNMHVLLGPGVNIYRNPLCGRNYEYMGEDPFLASRMVVAYIKAVKKRGVMPVIKHFIANNSENRRKDANSVVSERALREIYFPSFKAAVKEASVPAVMNAYNLVNGEYCGESKWLLIDILRNEWGFNGMIISDWDSIWNSDRALKHGPDIEMPGGHQTFVMAPDKAKELIGKGIITEKDIDFKVKNIVRACLMMDLYKKGFAEKELNKLEEHAKVALNTAREGVVLLKNRDKLLPLATSKRVVVIGPHAAKTPTTGGGSGGVRPENPVSLFSAIQKFYPQAELLKDFDSDKIAGADAVFICVGLNKSLVLNDPRVKKKSSISAEQAAFNKKKGPIEGEGRDRGSFDLPKEQNRLIKQCAGANKNSVVIVTSGGAVHMTPWIEKVKSVIWEFYPGQNGTIATAEILAGKVNPSGKLPISIEKEINDNPSTKNFNIGWRDSKPKFKVGCRTYQNIDYKEGIFIGYRYYDTNSIKPLFPFGHGLSYTTFKYGKPEVIKKDNKILVSLNLTNTGKCPGAETAQLYVRDVKCTVPRPQKELKGFGKVFLKPGESKPVVFELDDASFAFWNPKTKKWTVEPGEFEILIGSSSRDIRQKIAITK
jgi:beta-glucosidase